MNSGRREFFKVVGTAAAAAAAAAPVLRPAESVAAVVGKAATQATTHALFLEGSPIGFVRRFEGGDGVGVVVKEYDEFSAVVRKHIGSVHYEDILLSYGEKMPPALYEWIRVFLARDPALRSGAIASYTGKGKATGQLNFTNARISEIIFPELDATKKEPAFIDLRLTPESTQNAVSAFPAPSGISKEKAWVGTNFRVLIGAVDQTATSRIRKIDAITVKQNAAVSTAVAPAFDTINLEPLDVGPIVFTVPEQFAKPFQDWQRQFLAQGPSAQETFLIIECLSPDKKAVVNYSLYFGGVGIVRVTRPREDGKAQAVRNVEVELYAETVSFYQGPVPTA